MAKGISFFFFFTFWICLLRYYCYGRDLKNKAPPLFTQWKTHRTLVFKSPALIPPNELVHALETGEGRRCGSSKSGTPFQGNVKLGQEPMGGASQLRGGASRDPAPRRTRKLRVRTKAARAARCRVWQWSDGGGCGLVGSSLPPSSLPLPHPLLPGPGRPRPG